MVPGDGLDSHPSAQQGVIRELFQDFQRQATFLSNVGRRGEKDPEMRRRGSRLGRASGRTRRRDRAIDEGLEGIDARLQFHPYLPAHSLEQPPQRLLTRFDLAKPGQLSHHPEDEGLCGTAPLDSPQHRRVGAERECEQRLPIAFTLHER